jgi:hypothetical protein
VLNKKQKRGQRIKGRREKGEGRRKSAITDAYVTATTESENPEGVRELDGGTIIRQ